MGWNPTNSAPTVVELHPTPPMETYDCPAWRLCPLCCSLGVVFVALCMCACSAQRSCRYRACGLNSTLNPRLEIFGPPLAHLPMRARALSLSFTETWSTPKELFATKDHIQIPAQRSNGTIFAAMTPAPEAMQELFKHLRLQVYLSEEQMQGLRGHFHLPA